MLEKINDIFKRSPLLGNVLFFFLLLSVGIQKFIYYDNLIIRIFPVVILAVVALITRFPAKSFSEYKKKNHFLAALVAAAILFVNYYYVLGIEKVYYYLYRHSDPFDYVLIGLFFIFNVILSYWIAFSMIPSKGSVSKKKMIRTLILFGSLFFLFVLYLPLDSFIGNIDNFDFSVKEFALYLVGYFISLTIISSLVFLKLGKKVQGIVYRIVLAVLLASFVQYMFMNKKLPYLDMTAEGSHWDILTLSINIAVWVLIFVAVFLLPKFTKKKFAKISTALAGLILAFHVVSLIILLIFAPSIVYGEKIQYFFDGSNQYTLSSKNNVIVIVLDAYDNSDLKTHYENNPELFSNLNDFTVYTNTTSRFDSTVTSVNQFAGGCDFNTEYSIKEWLDSGWNSDNTKKFYSAMHEAGYECNAYNFELPYLEYAYGKFDNIVSYDEPKELKVAQFRVNAFLDDFGKLALYRCAPYIGKTALATTFDEMTFHFYAWYSETTTMNYYNSDYLDNLDIKITNDNNVFLYNHLYGVHEPCDFEVEDAKCYQIIDSVIAQLKEKGIYDNSTIIFMSDHGKHRVEDVAIDSSPIFIIKKAGETSDSITFNNAPISLDDFMGTVATCAGLDDPTQYGTSIYDFDDDTQRDRVVYEKWYVPDLPAVYSAGHLSYMSKFNAFVRFNIKSNVSEIKDIDPLKEEEGIEILPMKEYFG